MPRRGYSLHFELSYKRLSQGRFRGWPRAGAALSGVQAAQLRQLLAGALG